MVGWRSGLGHKEGDICGGGSYGGRHPSKGKGKLFAPSPLMHRSTTQSKKITVEFKGMYIRDELSKFNNIGMTKFSITYKGYNE